jgi:spore germination cell wall hydrolase CwlJ-like protein
MFTPILGIAYEAPSDLQCLTANIFFEARGESIKGMKAVADITLNRTKHQAFPESICEVVKQKQQFSWVKGDKRSKKVLSEDLRGFKADDLAAYQKAKSIATEALSEEYKSILPRNVISFHSVAITPHWANKMKKYSTIGSHVFYSFKRKG